LNSIKEGLLFVVIINAQEIFAVYNEKSKKGNKGGDWL
jgi:hypothetical protein